MELIKRVFYFSVIIIFIIGCLSGCGSKKENQNIDTKIATELDYLDNKISNFIDIITGNVKTKYDIVEENTKVKNNESNNGEKDSEKKSSETGSGGESNESTNSEEVTIMSMQYKKQSSADKENWEDIKSNIENLYISWATIQSDINTKAIVSDEKLVEITNGFDNLLIYATEQNEVKFIKESVIIYNNIIEIAERINYDKNKLYALKAKKKIYESYYNVLEENWDVAKNNIELANEYLQSVDNVQNKDKILLKNLLYSLEQKDKKIFFIKYSDIINELNYQLGDGAKKSTWGRGKKLKLPQKRLW
ncbi:MAG: hypothetical protein J6K42_02460 [Clostridia bacterium]|nr:hypothetical protein [Clostridia bacterium]